MSVRGPQARQSFLTVRGVCMVLSLAATGGMTLPSFAAHPTATTPIEHLIVVIGENQTFDAVFATYQPAHGEPVDNLLSQGIVLADGSPGPNFARAVQRKAQPGSRFSIDPVRARSMTACRGPRSSASPMLISTTWATPWTNAFRRDFPAGRFRCRATFPIPARMRHRALRPPRHRSRVPPAIRCTDSFRCGNSAASRIDRRIFTPGWP